MNKVTEAIEFLKLGTQDTVRKLKQEMEKAAEELNFEKAAKLRDTIKGIEKVLIKPYYNTSNILKDMLGPKKLKARIQSQTSGLKLVTK